MDAPCRGLILVSRQRAETYATTKPTMSARTPPCFWAGETMMLGGIAAACSPGGSWPGRSSSKCARCAIDPKAIRTSAIVHYRPRMEIPWCPPHVETDPTFCNHHRQQDHRQDRGEMVDHCTGRRADPHSRLPVRWPGSGPISGHGRAPRISDRRRRETYTATKATPSARRPVIFWPGDRWNTIGIAPAWRSTSRKTASGISETRLSWRPLSLLADVASEKVRQ